MKMEEQSSFLYEAGQTVPPSSSVSSGVLGLSTPSPSQRQPPSHQRWALLILLILLSGSPWI